MTCGKVDLGCTKCRLCAKRVQVVPGNGSCKSSILFLGEAPGREEDLYGRPFVGRAGRLLDETLAELGVPRPEVFVTNLCLCRPPNNRRPRGDEILTCTTLYLGSSFSVVRPKVVCALGQTAASFALESKEPMSELVGKVYPRSLFGVDAEVIAAYHPAGALRLRKYMPSFKKTIKQGLEAAGLL